MINNGQGTFEDPYNLNGNSSPGDHSNDFKFIVEPKAFDDTFGINKTNSKMVTSATQ